MQLRHRISFYIFTASMLLSSVSFASEVSSTVGLDVLVSDGQACVEIDSTNAPKAADKMTEVTRWGREGLEAGDWIVKGKNTWWNYIRSFKWQPKWMPGGNIPAKKALGETFKVPKSTVVKPYSEGQISNIIKWLFGQKQYKP